MSEWTAANNGSGKRIWFVCRPDNSLPFEERYHLNSRGDLIRYSSFEAASAVAARLNGGAA